MAARNHYTAAQCLGHVEQAEADALAWIEAIKPDLTEAEWTAYRAGFRAGARDALKLLRVHGGLAEGFDAY